VNEDDVNITRLGEVKLRRIRLRLRKVKLDYVRLVKSNLKKK